MVGYVFICGVDGFGEDISPAYEEGCYLNYDKAYTHLKELTEKCMLKSDWEFWEDGYCEDDYPSTDKELAQAEKNEDWDLFEKLMEKHLLTDIDAICHKLINTEYPPYGFYAMVEIEIKE